MSEDTGGARGLALYTSDTTAEGGGAAAHIPFSAGGQHADEDVEELSDEEGFQVLTQLGYKPTEDWDALREQLGVGQEDDAVGTKPEASIAEQAEWLVDRVAADGWPGYLAKALKLSVAEVPLADVEAFVKWLNFGGSCPEEALHKFFVRYPFGLTWAQRFGAHILHAHRKGKVPRCKPRAAGASRIRRHYWLLVGGNLRLHFPAVAAAASVQHGGARYVSVAAAAAAVGGAVPALNVDTQLPASTQTKTANASKFG